MFIGPGVRHPSMSPVPKRGNTPSNLSKFLLLLTVTYDCKGPYTQTIQHHVKPEESANLFVFRSKNRRTTNNKTDRLKSFETG